MNSFRGPISRAGFPGSRFWRCAPHSGARANGSSPRFTTGFTLIEVIVAVGLFALVITLATGAYLVMMSVNQQAQAIATGVDNLSSALESMTRTIRTGSHYDCAGIGDCPNGGDSFALTDASGDSVTYQLSGTSIIETKTISGVTTTVILTDPSVTVSSLTFYTFGTATAQNGDYEQARATIIVSGSVSAGHSQPQNFTVETGATMRGSDI